MWPKQTKRTEVDARVKTGLMSVTTPTSLWRKLPPSNAANGSMRGKRLRGAAVNRAESLALRSRDDRIRLGIEAYWIHGSKPWRAGNSLPRTRAPASRFAAASAAGGSADAATRRSYSDA